MTSDDSRSRMTERMKITTLSIQPPFTPFQREKNKDVKCILKEHAKKNETANATKSQLLYITTSKKSLGLLSLPKLVKFRYEEVAIYNR